VSGGFAKQSTIPSSAHGAGSLFSAGFAIWNGGLSLRSESALRVLRLIFEYGASNK